jgi:hypothetical protein
MENNKTFVRVTNKDIFDKLICIEEKIIRMNGSLKLSKWMAATALVIALTAMGFIVKLII